MTAFPPAPYGDEVDLRDFQDMPLEVRRLRDSRLSATATGEEFMIDVLLWCASWHQIPAGSIPDDDAELAKLAGFGRVVSEWLRVKEGALRKWIRCSDGRYYHPVVVEKAWASWHARLEHRWARTCDRIRKENKARKEKGQSQVDMPPKPEFAEIIFPSENYAFPTERKAVPPETENIPAEKEDFPSDFALKGREGKGREYNTTSNDVVCTVPTENGKHPAESPVPDSAAESDLGGPKPAGRIRRRKKPTLRQLPSDWAPTLSHAERCQTVGLDVTVLAERFTNYHASKGSEFVDWDRAFFTWIGNEVDFRLRQPAVTTRAGSRPEVDLDEAIRKAQGGGR